MSDKIENGLMFGILLYDKNYYVGLINKIRN